MTDLARTGSLPRWLLWPDMHRSEAGSHGPLSSIHMGTETQGPGPSSIAFPGYKQGSGPQVEEPGLEPALIRDTDAGWRIRVLTNKNLYKEFIFIPNSV